MNEFITLGPDDICLQYQLIRGPSIWLKMSASQRFGAGDETALYRELCRLSLKGGPFVILPSRDAQDTTVILAFEFMCYDLAGEPTMTDLRERAQGYAKALSKMADYDYVAIDHDDLDAVIEFCRGFQESSVI